MLLHGGGLTGGMWKAQIEVLSERFHVIVPDTRGHGRSTNEAGRTSYAMLADDLRRLSEHLMLDKPVLVGFCDGGIIALTAALERPEAYGALVLGGAVPPVSQEDVSHYMDGMHRFYGPLARRQNLDDFDFNPLESDSTWRRFADQHRRPGEPHAWKTLLRDVWPMWMTPESYAHSAEELRTLRMPVLVILGDRDELFLSDVAARFVRTLPNGELAVLPGTGHATFKTSPELFNTLVLNFLTTKEFFVRTSSASARKNVQAACVTRLKIVSKFEYIALFPDLLSKPNKSSGTNTAVRIARLSVGQ